MEVPPIRYTRTSDDVSIAYWKAGNGPPLLWAWQAGFSHVELMCGVPTVPEMLERLMEERTVVAWDLRNTGLSQRDATEISPLGMMRDMAAVVGRCEPPVAIAGYQHHAVPMAMFAIANPELVSHLILVAPWRGGGPPDGFVGPATGSLYSIRPLDHKLFCESWANAIVGRDDPSMIGPLARLMEGSADGRVNLRGFWDGDLFELLPQVQTPVLVLHPRNHPWLEDAQRAVALAPNARLVMLDAPTIVPGGRATADAVCQFLAEGAPTGAGGDAPRSKSELLMILFTDLERHTQMMDRLGDAKGREILREHERLTRECLRANEGTEIKTMGDGFMASFASAQKALECAGALQIAVRDSTVLGDHVSVRVGINAGEPIAEADDLFGASVIVAARIAARAVGGEVLVSDVVRQLVAGKRFLFSDTGEHTLRGFEEPLRIWELRWG